jgi:outer membrane protein OmpA-like peptidoglycan-associated protein
LKSISGENTSKIFDFEQLLIRDAEIKDSWELNGKTYGIIRGKVIGKVRQLNSNFDARNPPPQTTSEYTKYTPDESSFILPPQRQVTDIVRDGGGVLKGCFSNIWRFLLALMFLLFLLWMLRGCIDNNDNSSDCCAERDQLLIENEELKKQKDSLEIKLSEMNDSIGNNGGFDDEELQDEINKLSSRVYFKGNSDEILKYSDKHIDKIVELISKSGNLEIEVRGFYNGNGGVVENLDFKRASRVKELLINKGINQNIISAIGKGQSFIDGVDDLDEIVIDGETVKWNRNMRVEIKIIKY